MRRALAAVSALTATVVLASCGGTTDTGAPGSAASTEARWTTSGVVAALDATISGRADLAAFTTPTGRVCQAFPPLGTGERTESGSTLDDYENAPDLEGRSTGTVIRTPDGTAGARIQGSDGYADSECTAAAQARLNASKPS